MDLLVTGIVLGAVVLLSLLGAWALGRRRDRQTPSTDAAMRSVEDLKAEDHQARDQLDRAFREYPGQDVGQSL